MVEVNKQLLDGFSDLEGEVEVVKVAVMEDEEFGTWVGAEIVSGEQAWAGAGAEVQVVALPVAGAVGGAGSVARV